MRTTAVATVSIVLLGLLSPGSPLGEAPLPSTIEFAVSASDEADVASALEEDGVDLVDLEMSAESAELEMTSTLGDGTPAESVLAVSYATQQATLEVEAATTGELTTLELEIHELNDDEISFTATEDSSGAVETVSSLEAEGAVAVVLGIPLALTALKSLLAAALVVVIGGATYIAVAETIAAIDRSGSNYQHFVAVRQTSGLFVGGGLTQPSAITRARGGQDVWSRSSSGARSVCGSVRSNGSTIGPEIDASGRGRVYHHHPKPKNGAQCFYGTSR